MEGRGWSNCVSLGFQTLNTYAGDSILLWCHYAISKCAAYIRKNLFCMWRDPSSFVLNWLVSFLTSFSHTSCHLRSQNWKILKQRMEKFCYNFPRITRPWNCAAKKNSTIQKISKRRREAKLITIQQLIWLVTWKVLENSIVLDHKSNYHSCLKKYWGGQTTPSLRSPIGMWWCYNRPCNCWDFCSRFAKKRSQKLHKFLICAQCEYRFMSLLRKFLFFFGFSTRHSIFVNTFLHLPKIIWLDSPIAKNIFCYRINTAR